MAFLSPLKHAARRLLPLLPAFFVIAALSACQKKETIEPLEMQRYALPKQGVEIYYPLSWGQRYAEMQVIFAPLAEQDNPLSPKVAIEVVSGAGYEETPKTIKQIVDEGLKKIAPANEPKVLLREKAQLLGREAVHLTISLKIGGEAFKEELLYVPHNGNFIGLYYLAPIAVFESYLPIFHNMLLKLSLTGEKTQ